MIKKDAAKILYIQGFTQVDIAKFMGVGKNTVNKWAIAGKWKEKKINLSLLKDNSVQRIMEMIDYQTKAITRKIELWKDEDPLTTKLIERGDIDALQKLFTTIKKDSKKWSDYVSVIREFFEFLQANDLEIAQELSDLADTFLHQKRELL